MRRGKRIKRCRVRAQFCEAPHGEAPFVCSICDDAVCGNCRLGTVCFICAEQRDDGAEQVKAKVDMQAGGVTKARKPPWNKLRR
jgi:hypothetical protein